MLLAKRKDEGKSRVDLVEAEFTLGVGHVMGNGAKKYDVDNWKRSLNTEAHDDWVNTCKACLIRHTLAHSQGEIYDAESGYAHMYHVATNAMFIDYYDRNKKDDKFSEV